jgi:Ca2+-dependent lipid-binding protein
VGANFEVEIFDWNQIEQSKSLGSAKIELAELEPFQGIERVFSLSHTRYGDKGEVRLRLTFQPEVIAKSRKNTSTFSTAGRAMTQLGGLPVGGAKGVASGVGKVFRKDHAKGALSVDSGDSVFSPPAGQASIPVEPSMSTSSNPASATSTLSVVTAPTAFPSASTASLDGSINEPGTLRVTIMSAKDISADGEAAKPYVTLRVGDKEHKTKHVARTMSPEWFVSTKPLPRSDAHHAI